MAQGFFEVNSSNWTAHNFSAGQWSIKIQSTNASLLISEDMNGEVIFNSKDFNNGVIPINVDAQKDFYFKISGEVDTSKVFYSDSFFFRVGGGGGGGNYTFTAPLVDTQSNISIALSQSLKVTQDRLDLNLTANTDFRNALVGIDEAKKIATYTSVGRVMPQPSHFDLNALNGELRLDLTSGGVLNVNFATKQEYNNLASVVQTLLSGVDIIGKIPNDNTQVTANTQLLTDFVQAEKSRAPRGGDIVLTTEQPNTAPSFVWIYTSTNAWDNIGTTGAGIATQNTIGLIKGSNTLQIALDGTANVQGVVFDSGNQVVNGNKDFRGITTLFKTVRMGYGGSVVLLTPEDNSTKTLRFRDTSIGTNNKFNLDLENVCGLTGIKDPTSARDAVPRDWANSQYIPKVTTTATNGIQVTASAQKMFNIDYVVTGTGYRNWSGIQLRAKQGTGSFETMWNVTYRDSNNLGIFMSCIGNKLTFENATKIKGVSCETSDADDMVASKGYVDSKIKVLPSGTQPTTTNIGNMQVAFVLK